MAASKTSEVFARARTSEQRRDRALHLKSVTRELLDSCTADSVSVGAIARGAGLAKSGVQRYWPSREVLLLTVMYDEHGIWLRDLQNAMPTAGRHAGFPADLASAIARTICAQTVLCDLISVSPVLVKNVAQTDLPLIRSQARDVKRRLSSIVAPACPHLIDPGRINLLMAAVHAFVGTAWAWSTPHGVPELAIDATDHGLERTVSALLLPFIEGLTLETP